MFTRRYSTHRIGMVIMLAVVMSGAAVTAHAEELAAPAEPQIRIKLEQ